MTRRSPSLRLRLFVLILAPLVVVALLMGYWRYSVAQKTAEDLFDRALLSAALAISRDVAVSGGDALLPSTRDLIHDVAGGEVFYHATGPGGIYLTGYAYPPVARGQADSGLYLPAYFEAVYRGEPVRVLRLTERVTVGGLTGDTTVTVWQRISERTAFVHQLAVRAASLLGVLLVTLALVVWFGVQYGLRPLTDLRDAIAARSPEDLSTIKRPVPPETQGIVDTLNRLFGQVESSIGAHQVFISDAAHQLRNPAAAVQSMAEAVRDAKSDDDRRQRVNELVQAARASARVAEQLLSLDRLKQPHRREAMEEFDLGEASGEICAEMGPLVLSRGIEFEFVAHHEKLMVRADRFFVSEAIKNLIDNALKHGGSRLSSIRVEIGRRDGMAKVTVIDDGAGLSPEDTKAAFSRFSQVEPSDGSGLGLAIASSVAERHRGTLTINPSERGASLTLALPMSAG